MLLQHDVGITAHILNFLDVSNLQRKIMLRKSLVADLKYLREVAVTQLFDDFEVVIFDGLVVAVLIQILTCPDVSCADFLVLLPVLLLTVG